MAELSKEQIEAKLKEYIDPFMEKDLVSTKCIRNVMIEGDQVVVDVVLGFPAEGYKEEKIRRAQGDVEKFLAVLKEYQSAKDITRKRLYLETMEKVLPGVKKFIIDSQSGDGLLKLLPLEGAPFTSSPRNPNPNTRRSR